MKLELTAEDLEGDYANGMDCPIARALKRLGHKNVSVGGATVDFDSYINIKILNAFEFVIFIDYGQGGDFIVELEDITEKHY